MSSPDAVSKLLMGMLALALGPVACELVDYSPHQDDLPDSARELTAKNIADIQDQPATSQVRFAFVSDTQNSYEQTRDFVAHVNARDDLDFVIHGGDITHYGLIQEYEWMFELFEPLEVPYLTVVGNHDLRANGGRLYEAIYGPRSYAFVWASKKFIFLDMNSRHYGFDDSIPDLEWLAAELEPGPDFKRIVVVGHTPPSHNDFDPDLELGYARLLEENELVQLSLYGHEHKFRFGYPYGEVPYLVGDNAGDRNYVVVTLSGDQVTYERVEF